MKQDNIIRTRCGDHPLQAFPARNVVGILAQDLTSSASGARCGVLCVAQWILQKSGARSLPGLSLPTPMLTRPA